MRKGTKIGLIAGSIIVVIALIFLCTAMFSANKAAPAPVVTSTPVVQETEDCDKKDRAKREWEECGFGVLLDPGKKSTAPVLKPSTKPPVARCTPTRTRKC